MPIPDATLEISIANASAMGEEGFALILHLARQLGLRGLESLMSMLDLERNAIEARGLKGAEVNITRGTKGGRNRCANVLHARASESVKG